jgi:hypothetical protein
MSEQRISDVTERDIDVFLTYAERARESGRQPDYRTETIEMLWLDLLDARRDRDEAIAVREKAERELAEARKALLWYAYACDDQDEPVEVRAAYNAAERARGNKELP